VGKADQIFYPAFFVSPTGVAVPAFKQVVALDQAMKLFCSIRLRPKRTL
jgi:hypothetical protein